MLLLLFSLPHRIHDFLHLVAYLPSDTSRDQSVEHFRLHFPNIIHCIGFKIDVAYQVVKATKGKAGGFGYWVVGNEVGVELLVQRNVISEHIPEENTLVS